MTARPPHMATAPEAWPEGKPNDRPLARKASMTACRGRSKKPLAAHGAERGGGVPARVQAGDARIGEKRPRQAEKLLGDLAEHGRPGDDLEQKESLAQADAEQDGDDHDDDEAVVAGGRHLQHQPGQPIRRLRLQGDMDLGLEHRSSWGHFSASPILGQRRCLVNRSAAQDDQFDRRADVFSQALLAWSGSTLTCPGSMRSSPSPGRRASRCG